MVGVQKRKIQWAVPLLIAVCFVSIPAQAQYGGGSKTTASADTKTCGSPLYLSPISGLC